MLEGVVPYPPEFQRIYRDKGYWEDRSLRDELQPCLEKFAERVAVIDETGQYSYGELDRLSTNLALNLVALGLKPARPASSSQLPNVREFAVVYVALQKAGCIHIAALVTHRFAEIGQFVALSGAAACVIPDTIRGFDYREMAERVRAENGHLKHLIVMGEATGDSLSLQELIERPVDGSARTRSPPSRSIRPIPRCSSFPAAPRGIPKLIPRTHNDYAYNSKQAARETEVTPDSRLLIVPADRAHLPLALPRAAGVPAERRRRGPVHQRARSERLRDDREARRDPCHRRAGAAYRLDQRSRGRRFRPVLGADDRQRRPAAPAGGEAEMREVYPNAFVQENFGMAEGTLMFVDRGDSEDAQLETVGQPMCPDDEVMLLDEEDNVVPFGEVGEFCVSRPLYPAGLFRRRRAQRARLHQ